MTLNALRNQLSQFHPVSTAITDFKSVLGLYINTEPQPNNFESISGLKNVLTVKMPWRRELITGPGTLFCIFRDNFF